MKVLKLNGRYAGYPKWKYALHFGTHTYDKLPRLKYAKAFTQLFGPDREYVEGLTEYMWNSYRYNENWTNDARRGRIYYNNEADLSAVMLVMSSQ